VNPVDYSDVQGLAKYGYHRLVEAKYFLLTVRDVRAAAEWLASAPVSTAEYREVAPDSALQVAFTYDGLLALGVPRSIADGFSTEFLQGITQPSRSRRLGDIGESAPSGWSWGGPAKAPHLMVMLFAKGGLAAFEAAVRNPLWNDAFEIAATLDTSNMHDHEPFGFRDSISDPAFDWSRKQPIPANAVDYRTTVALGELLLGYPNEYNKYTDRPLLDPADDPANDLAPAEDHPEKKDLGRNGTYLVLRQLEQDVHGFWRYLNMAASGNANERYRLGATMVGRTLEGVPVIAPDSEPGANDFTYDADPPGTRCPLGAHIRRANPRNADFVGHPTGLIAGALSRLALPRPKMRVDLIASTRFHRLLRRGREYGVTLPPDEAVERDLPADRPGIHFVCLCANISRQFEFVQNAWLMSTKFNGLTEESDPLLGNRAAVGDCPVTGNFSIPREGQLAQRLTGMPQFVTVRGGAYFFLPSLRALRYIAQAAKRSGTS
jgi:deferrochelatase/peroxidase EfeB